MYKQISLFLLIPFLLFYALPVSADEKEENTWQNELVYYIVVDRFHNGNPNNDGADFNPKDPLAYHGGDIEGIIKKLDYIQEMGFTTVTLSSIFQAEDYAGKQIEDHRKVEEHFGNLDDVKRLVKEAHKRDMKIMLEFIANHVGPNHSWLQDETKQAWFHEKGLINDTQKEENKLVIWYDGLPDLATENLETRDYIIDTAKWWISETNIDGFYIDHADTVDVEFWQLFQSEIKKQKEDFYLIGSLLDNRVETITSYQHAGFSSLLNEQFYKEASDVFKSVDRPITSITKVVEESTGTLSPFLDSDDTVRFTRKAIENQQHPGLRLKMAFSYMYMVPGAPVVYYGTEIALDGGAPPENRALTNFQSDEELIDAIAKLAKVRKSLPAITKGDYQVLYEKDGMVIFKRTFEDETAIVAINNTSVTQKINIAENKIAENKELRGLLIGDSFEEENGEYEFILDRETAEVYEIKEKVGLNLPLISVFILVPSLFILFLIAAKRRGKKREE